MAVGLNAKQNIAMMQGKQTQVKSLKEFVSTAAKSTTRANTFSKPASSNGLYSPTRFGIGAQRSKVGTGQHLNAFAFNSNTMSAERNSMNSRAFFSSDFGMPNFGHVHQSNNKANGWQVALASMAALNALAPTITDLVNSGKTEKTSSTDKSNDIANSNIPDNNSKTSNTPASLTAMKGANESTALSAAITKAEADQSAIPAKLQTANSELSSLKGETESLKTKSDEAQKKYDDNIKDISETSGKVNTLTSSIETCKNALATLDQQIEASLDKYGLPGPQTGALKAAKTQKEAQLKQLESDLSAAQNKLEELQGQTKELKQAAGDAKDVYDKNINDIKTKQDDIDQLEQQKNDFEKEIPKQKKRLQELEKKEDSELNKVNTDITKYSDEIEKLMSSVNPNDENGLSKGEIKNKEKADKKQGELDQLKAKQTELQKRKAIRNLPTENHNGIQFKTGRMPDGTTAYFVGGKEVNQQEYLAQLTQAQNPDTKLVEPKLPWQTTVSEDQRPT